MSKEKPNFEEFLKKALEPDVNLRQGQKFMNLLCVSNPHAYAFMSYREDLDPYYDDRKLWAAVEYVRENWKDQ